MSSFKPVYRRILLKLSGEALAESSGHGLDPSVSTTICRDIRELVRGGVQIAVVVGGGNIFRGGSPSAASMNRSVADAIGMLATVINSLALGEYLAREQVAAQVMSANRIDKVAELYTAARAVQYLEQGRVVIVAGGTGNPYFTTDTAAALRCAEIGAEVLLKATKVEGVYDSDPVGNPAAVKFDSITHEEALARGLKVMDATAFSFCMVNRIPIIVFKLEQGSLRKCVEGVPVGTIVAKDR
jgi:uridylate kinase